MGYRCPVCKKNYDTNKEALWNHINNSKECKEFVQSQLKSAIRTPEELDAQDKEVAQK